MLARTLANPLAFPTILPITYALKKGTSFAYLSLWRRQDSAVP